MVGQRRRGSVVTGLVALACVVGPTVIRAEEPVVDDPSGVFSFRPQKRWKRLPQADGPGGIATYHIWFGIPRGDPTVIVNVRRALGFQRATLAHHMMHAQFGDLVADTAARGDGFVESAMTGASTKRPVWRRFYEKDGRVVLVGFHVMPNEFQIPYHRQAVQDMLGSFELQKLPDADGPPDGYRAAPHPRFTVWTTTDLDEKAPAAALDELVDGWRQAGALLAGAPYSNVKPTVILHADEREYDAQAPKEGRSPIAMLDILTGRMHVNLDEIKGRGYEGALHRQGARLRIGQHFGGIVPRWVREGLAEMTVITLEAGGNPSKPKQRRVSGIRAYVAREARSLRDHINADPHVNDWTEELAAELWAWHAFFRFGAGAATYGNPYRESLEQLRESGDPKAAAAEWDGTDYSAQLKKFQSWVKRWRP